jgi:O-antigen biosynthesis protein WbqV
MEGAGGPRQIAPQRLIHVIRDTARARFRGGTNGFAARAIRSRCLSILRSTYRNWKTYALDLALSIFAIVTAVALRLGPASLIQDRQQIEALTVMALTFALICAVTFPIAGLYKRNWRFASLLDYFALVRAIFVASIALTAAMFLYSRLAFVPRSTIAIEMLIFIALMAASRIRYRHEDIKSLASPRRWSSSEFDQLVPVLLVGAGQEADLYLRALQRDRSSTYWPVGLLDACPTETSTLLRGVPVLGTLDDFEAVYADLDARGQKPRHLIFTQPLSSDRSATESLVGQAERRGLAVSRLRPPTELRNTPLTQEFEVRPIELTDLLERPQAALDMPALKRLVNGRRILVTGAGGSIGSELVKQVAALGPAHIVLIDNCEFNLYTIDLDLAETYPDVPRSALIGDVRDAGRLHDLFARNCPEIVFHAAALKHVPMVEHNPCEGVLTNVLGTMNVAEASQRWGALGMVQISTDKVVNSTSVMGATKRLAELYCQALDLNGLSGLCATRFMTVRFGNVLGSSGSLIPLFKRQLARGGPLTVTHPEMRRFFMTIREAVELTLQASAYGLEKQLGQGEIFVLDMGKPVKVMDIARRMIRLAGYEPDRDLKIEIVGCRPGEKLFEELFDATDKRVSSPVPGVFGAVPTPVPLPVIYEVFERLRSAAERGDTETLFNVMRTMLPGFRAGRECTADSDQPQAQKRYGRKAGLQSFKSGLPLFFRKPPDAANSAERPRELV